MQSSYQTYTYQYSRYTSDFGRTTADKRVLDSAIKAGTVGIHVPRRSQQSIIIVVGIAATAALVNTGLRPCGKVRRKVQHHRCLCQRPARWWWWWWSPVMGCHGLPCGVIEIFLRTRARAAPPAVCQSTERDVLLFHCIACRVPAKQLSDEHAVASNGARRWRSPAAAADTLAALASASVFA